MERLHASLPRVEHIPFLGIGSASTFEQDTGPNQWSGRCWLPAGDWVQPTHKYCLIRADGQLGEMTLDRFSLSGV
jgi:hypothetical protein